MAARARQGRRVVGARRHRIALVRPGAARHRSAHREVLGDLTTVVRSGRSRRGSREAFQRAPARTTLELVDIRSRTSRRCCAVRQRREGRFSVGQVCAGHKNDLSLEVCGATGIARAGARSTRTSSGSAAATARTDPQKDRRSSTRRRAATRSCPAATGKLGRRVLQRDARHLRVHRRRQDASATAAAAFATFEDGYRANCIVDAILDERDARAASGRR